jgi:hypothetical protein
LLDHAAQELTQALGLVAKLKSGRESKKRATGKGCGRKSLAELSPEAVALARKLRRYPANGTSARCARSPSSWRAPSSSPVAAPATAGRRWRAWSEPEVRIAISQAAFDAIARTLDPLRRATTVAGLDQAGGTKAQYPDQGAPCFARLCDGDQKQSRLQGGGA